MTAPEIVVAPDATTLAADVAARLVERLARAQADGGVAHVCLTGGGIGTAVLAAVAASGDRDCVDWGALHVWWGDDRYLPEGDPERNETGARTALLDVVPVAPALVHPMPPAGSYPDVETAAEAYALELAAAVGPGDQPDGPAMDVCLLGIGPDAHVASLFPGHPAGLAGGTVVAVHGSPKPPPTRISLTMPLIRRSREVWVLAAGAAKAEAVRQALAAGADPHDVPAAGARGTDRTLFLLDMPAADLLPADLTDLGS